MIKTSVEKLADVIGFEVGTSDDVTQAKLINSFCRGIANSMNDHQMERQVCAFVDQLDDKSHKVIKAMYDFIQLKEKDA